MRAKIHTLPRAAAAGTLSDRVAAHLRRGIIDGSIPPGARLPETAVGRQLGISRVPVREALFALQREGLVEFSDSGRAFVRELTADDFAELYALRLTLEPRAARAASARMTPQARARLEAIIAATARAGSLAELTGLDLDFHEAVVGIAGNRRLLRVWRSLRGELEAWLGRMHRQRSDRHHDAISATVAGHRELLASLQGGAGAECERLFRRHIRGWRDWLPH